MASRTGLPRPELPAPGCSRSLALPPVAWLAAVAKKPSSLRPGDHWVMLQHCDKCFISNIHRPWSSVMSDLKSYSKYSIKSTKCSITFHDDLEITPCLDVFLYDANRLLPIALLGSKDGGMGSAEQCAVSLAPTWLPRRGNSSRSLVCHLLNQRGLYNLSFDFLECKRV